MKVTHLAIPLLFSAPAWAIVGGVKASGEQAAVMVVGTRGAETGVCSGVFVSPHVVVTAAHCLDDSYTYEVFAGDDHDDDDQLEDVDFNFEVTSLHRHPDYNVQSGEHDLGVLITSHGFLGEVPTLNDQALDGDDIDRAVRMVGYGQTEPGGAIGVRMEANSTIAGINPTGLAMQGTPNICLYDSGGPTFAVDTGALLGIHQSVESASCDGLGVDVRVDIELAFLQTYTADDAPDPIDEDEFRGDTQASCNAGAAAPWFAVAALALRRRRARGL